MPPSWQCYSWWPIGCHCNDHLLLILSDLHVFKFDCYLATESTTTQTTDVPNVIDTGTNIVTAFTNTPTAITSATIATTDTITASATTAIAMSTAMNTTSTASTSTTKINPCT
ncbi:unnamed protein product [Rotaria magnacalcarata]